MKADIEPGKYIVAVSGGVDSVVLLNLLARQKDLELVVAHFNHGIRAEASLDEEFVRNLGTKLDLPVEVGLGRLGKDASEEQARKSRYEFLNEVKDKHEAAAIITAHHQDDLLETAVINILRGTGPRGLAAISINREIMRPLLNVPKKEILEYAGEHNLEWVEDESNQDTRYLRNSVRQILQKKLTLKQRAELFNYINEVIANQEETDELMNGLDRYIFKDKDTIKRSSFIFLPADVSNEVLVRWLRQHRISADRPLINRLSTSIKTGRPGSTQDVNKLYKLKLNIEDAHLESQG